MAGRLTPVGARRAQELMDKGALMVDVREPHEYAQVSIPGSQNVPLSRLAVTSLAASEQQPIVFFCAAGSRTASYAAQLAAKAGRTQAYVMEGGISSWRMAGLPVVEPAGNGGQRGFLSRFFG